MKAPAAKRIAHVHELHSDVRQDDYYWLKDRENPEVIQHLEQENAFYEETMQPLEPLTERIFDAMVARIPAVEEKVPVQDGAYYYYSRMESSLQYPIYTRKRAANRNELESACEEVILDVNALAQEDGYLSVTVQRMSPDHTRLAYLENRDGTDKYTVFVKDLTTGELLADRVTNVFLEDSLEWDATGEYLFYVTVDDCQRPYQVWRHRLGDADGDVLLYEETDVTFTLQLYKSNSGQYVFVKSGSTMTSEIRYLDANQPLEQAQLVDARRRGILYEVEHWGNDLLILTNENATNFRVLRRPLVGGAKDDQEELFAYDDARYLESLQPFRDALFLTGREDGLTQIWKYRDGKLTRFTWDEPLYTVSLAGNRDYETIEVLVQYHSMLTPKTTLAMNLTNGERETLLIAPVAGEYDQTKYRQERLWATATDGTKVPMAVVHHVGALNHGPAPLILQAYGSYGYSSDPHFDPSWLPLLDAGVIVAVAQIRGGSEMGRSWYEDGKLLKKRNTFTDFIDVAKDLIERGYTTSKQIAAVGGSAGGLLMGAVANMGGHLFQAIVPMVPFVDVVTTMLDESIPLTTLEWDEWGNPTDHEYYAYMKSYSPYDNVEEKDYPHMLITTGINDPRVGYWEPAKWVARLREMKTDDNVLLMKVNMGAGHFGASGRMNHLREFAGILAFILDKIGATV